MIDPAGKYDNKPEAGQCPDNECIQRKNLFSYNPYDKIVYDMDPMRKNFRCEGDECL